MFVIYSLVVNFQIWLKDWVWLELFPTWKRVLTWLRLFFVASWQKMVCTRSLLFWICYTNFLGRASWARSAVWCWSKVLIYILKCLLVKLDSGLGFWSLVLISLFVSKWVHFVNWWLIFEVTDKFDCLFQPTSVRLSWYSVLHVPSLNTFAALMSFVYLFVRNWTTLIYSGNVSWFVEWEFVDTRSIWCRRLFLKLTDNTHSNDHIFQLIYLSFQKFVFIFQWKMFTITRTWHNALAKRRNLRSFVYLANSRGRMGLMASIAFNLLHFND